jgi:hypothetical protein
MSVSIGVLSCSNVRRGIRLASEPSSKSACVVTASSSIALARPEGQV